MLFHLAGTTISVSGSPLYEIPAAASGAPSGVLVLGTVAPSGVIDGVSGVGLQFLGTSNYIDTDLITSKTIDIFSVFNHNFSPTTGVVKLQSSDEVGFSPSALLLDLALTTPSGSFFVDLRPESLSGQWIDLAQEVLSNVLL